MFPRIDYRKSAPGADELKIALDNRAFEIQLFWQRSNYFLVLMSALGIATFSIKDIWLSPLVACFATLCSWLWFKTNLGSKFWQESWEVEVVMLAKKARVRSFERPMEEVVAQVASSLSAGSYNQRRSVIRQMIDREIVKKPSVTYHMILLSLGAFVVWAIVTVVFGVRLVGYLCAASELCRHCGPWHY